MTDNQNKKLEICIRGMHCRSCEMLIEDNVSKLPGVDSVRVDHKTGRAEIIYRGPAPETSQLAAAVERAGYTLAADSASSGPQPFIRLSSADYRDLGIAALVLMALYFLAKAFGLTSLNLTAPSSGTGIAMPLLVGLTAGFSTCMALVGGLVLGVSARHAEKHPEATAAQKFRPHLWFNLGRIGSYTMLGGILGLVGSVFQLSSLTLGILTILVGLVMLLMGLQLIEIFPWADRFKLLLPKSFSRRLGIGRHEKEYSAKNSLVLGAVTFFLPCGFTQAMQLLAMSSGSFVRGASIMGLFALGTAPGLLGVGGLTSVVKGAFARRFFKFAGLAVILFALFNLSNGYRLTGWSIGAPDVDASLVGKDPNVVMENGVQVVRMTQSSRGYSPNSFTLRKGVPVRWIVTATDPYSCSSGIAVPSLGIRKNLEPGENVIEFTPEQAGSIRFTCTMGMYPGSFYVVDTGGQSSSAPTTLAAASPSSGQAPAAASCGGKSGGCGGCGGGAPKPTSAAPAPTVESGSDVQVIKASFTVAQDISPNTFTVKAGQPVRFEVTPQEDGQGCMSTIKIPGLYDRPVFLEKGKTIVMEFTPSAGSYDITCAMGVPRGKLIAR